jgi:hypothetical protein
MDKITGIDSEVGVGSLRNYSNATGMMGWHKSCSGDFKLENTTTHAMAYYSNSHHGKGTPWTSYKTTCPHKTHPQLDLQTHSSTFSIRHQNSYILVGRGRFLNSTEYLTIHFSVAPETPKFNLLIFSYCFASTALVYHPSEN